MIEPCSVCGKHLQRENEPEGFIYVRMQRDGEWGTYPICAECWDLSNPGRMPVRMRHLPAKESE